MKCLPKTYETQSTTFSLSLQGQHNREYTVLGKNSALRKVLISEHPLFLSQITTITFASALSLSAHHCQVLPSPLVENSGCDTP